MDEPRANGPERRGLDPAGLRPASGAPPFHSTRAGRGAPPAAASPTSPAAVVERLGVPMFSLDVRRTEPLDVVFSAFNRALSETTGLAPEDVVGRRPDDFLPPRQVDNVLANYRRCIAARGPVSYDEAHAVGGDDRWYRTTLTPWIAACGTVTAIVGSAVEVTEARRRADEDARTIAGLRRLSEEVRTFAAMAAHDVRSPLAAIEGLVEVIERDLADLDEDKLALIRACGDTARGAREQMDDLLRHANALGVGGVASLGRCDLARVGRDVSMLADPEGALEITWPGEVVRVDGVALTLILRNLVSNAARHAGGRVAVSMEPISADRAAFVVADDGPGFAPGTDPFEDAGPLARDDRARGFGLQSARYLVEARGGDVGVVGGHPLRGGAVRFTLPCEVLGPEAEGPANGADAGLAAGPDSA